MIPAINAPVAVYDWAVETLVGDGMDRDAAEALVDASINDGVGVALNAYAEQCALDPSHGEDTPIILEAVIVAVRAWARAL